MKSVAKVSISVTVSTLLVGWQEEHAAHENHGTYPQRISSGTDKDWARTR